MSERQTTPDQVTSSGRDPADIKENSRKRRLEVEARSNMKSETVDQKGAVPGENLSKRQAKKLRRELEKNQKKQQQMLADPNFKQCQFVVVKKNRRCRQRVINGCDFCGEHLMTSDQKEGDHARIPCPLDPSHSCYKHLLESHMKKCNAREKELPPYLIKNINGEDVLLPETKVSVHTVSDEDLHIFISRIESIYKESVSNVITHKGDSHPLIAEELDKFKECATLQKHLRQQGHLIQMLCEKDLVVEDHVFVEFGAGRGQLATWVMRVLGDEAVRKSSFVLVDRGSQRYKADNRFIDEWGSAIYRIRADIRHLSIELLEPFQRHGGKVVGFCKHLCGVAIDLALRCVTNTLGENHLPKGLVMAVCCHHRCEWRWYCGQSWLKELGFNESEFQLMVSIAGWATCGDGPPSTKPRRDRTHQRVDATIVAETDPKQVRGKTVETSVPVKSNEASSVDSTEQGDGDNRSRPAQSVLQDEPDHKCADTEHERPGRYQAMGLSTERRREIGYMVKSILDEGRLRFLRSRGMTADRVNFISSEYTPENFAIVATAPTLDQ